MIFDPFYDMLQARKKKVTQATLYNNWVAGAVWHFNFKTGREFLDLKIENE